MIGGLRGFGGFWFNEAFLRTTGGGEPVSRPVSRGAVLYLIVADCDDMGRLCECECEDDVCECECEDDDVWGMVVGLARRTVCDSCARESCPWCGPSVRV